MKAQQRNELFLHEYLRPAEHLRSDCELGQLSMYAQFTLKFRKQSWYLKYVLLLSGDTNLHPGPVKHPYSTCSKSVRKKVISCIKCGLWVHKKCMQPSRIVANDPDFICQPCLDKSDHDTWHDLPFASVYKEPRNYLKT